MQQINSQPKQTKAGKKTAFCSQTRQLHKKRRPENAADCRPNSGGSPETGAEETAQKNTYMIGY